MKYAVIQSGGKQYKVKEGDQLLVERIEGKEGDVVAIDQVVMVNDGGKLNYQAEGLSKVEVKATILKQVADEKVIVFKHRPKKGYRRKRGHRQPLTKIKIEEIAAPKAKAQVAKEKKGKQEEEKLKQKKKVEIVETE